MSELTDWPLLIEQCNDWIRKAQAPKARKTILNLQHQKIPREYKQPIANIARRLNLLQLSILMLNRIVRPKTPIHPAASPAELVDYAASLTRLGAIDEAFEILSSVDPRSHPQTLLYQSIAHFWQWAYPKATPLLEKYVKSEKISDYQKLVGKVNLAACYVSTDDHPKAISFLPSVIEQTQTEGHQLLHANASELLAQFYIEIGDFNKAIDQLEKAKSILSGNQLVTAFYVKKWRGIVDVLKDKGSVSSINRLGKVKQEAVESGNWQTLRECDFYQAVATRDNQLFDHVYFGTPFKYYRQRMIGIYQPEHKIPKFYDWSPHSADGPNRVAPSEPLDLKLGGIWSKELFLKPGLLQHQALWTLTSDFYRPFRLGQLHSQLFPGEYFNPDTSPDRVSKVIQSLRRWGKQHQLPFLVSVRSGFFKLKCDGDFLFRVYLTSSNPNSKAVYLDRLRKKWGSRSFSSRGASEALSVSAKTIQRLMSWAVENRKVLKIGTGNSTRYRFGQRH